MNDLIKIENLEKQLAELEAALAERERMLQRAEASVLRVLPTFSPTTAKLIRRVFADIWLGYDS